MEKNIKIYALTICQNIIQYLRWLLLGALTGIVVGGVCSLFSWCLVFAADIRTACHYTFLLLPLCGLIIVFLYKKLNYEENKGTDSVIESIHSDISLSPKMAFLIFVSTVITIFGGGSVGREGAAVQIGGSLGKTLGDILRFDDKDKRIIIMSGIAAAFSALFGTPMTASLFAIEVASIGTMYYAALVPCICAALISKKIAALLGVKEDAFHVFNDLPLSVPSGLKVVFLAACCAAVSILFCLTLQLAHKLLHRCFSNSYLRIVSGGCLIILLTLLCGTQDYLGTGIHIIEQALDGHAVPYAFLLKILFTSITIAAGYRGGEIVPSLFIGATFGCFLGGLIGLPLSLSAAVGMVSIFCGVTNCLFASLIISFELFGFADAYYYLIAITTSYMLSGYFGLYHTQRITFSKYENSPTNQRTNHWFK